jgi:hypothetical protein
VRLADIGPELVPMRWGLGSAFNLQRAGRDGRRKTDVSFGLQTHALHRASVRLLRVATSRGRQTALFHHRAADGSVLSIAGLWDQWKEPDTGETILSATLMVTAANDFTRPIHDRMPVLLDKHDLDAWLTGKAGAEILRPAPNDLLRMWLVSKRVNASGRGDTMTRA